MVSMMMLAKMINTGMAKPHHYLAFECLAALKNSFKCGKKLPKMPYQGKVLIYPMDPSELQDSHPEVWPFVCPPGKVLAACPLDEIVLTEIRSSLPARKTHASITSHTRTIASAPCQLGRFMPQRALGNDGVPAPEICNLPGFRMCSPGAGLL